MAKKRKVSSRPKAAQRAKSPRAPIGTSLAVSLATNKRKAVPERVAALAQVPLASGEGGRKLEAIMNVLNDAGEPTAVRMAAMQSLQAASFSVAAFESNRGQYRAALRKVAQDKDPELRQRALSILARQKDGFAQKRLLEGLENPEKAAVPPEKALQLLAYDAHTDAYKQARTILNNPPTPAAKHAALRLLATDAAAVPLFERILLDKNELKENRQISASALHALNPDKMQERARQILLDGGDYDDIKATSLTALSQFGNHATLSGDHTLLESVDRLKTTGSAKLQHSVNQFLTKYQA